MHRSTSSFAPPASTNLIGTDTARIVNVTLTREEQEVVNETRRQGTSSTTIRRHNSNINKLITFVTEKVTQRSIQLSTMFYSSNTTSSSLRRTKKEYICRIKSTYKSFRFTRNTTSLF